MPAGLGTRTETYVGDLEILGANNAPKLDEIAWYGGNAGVDFELAKGWDLSGWEDKQYQLNLGGTHPVGLKEAQSLGLVGYVGECLRMVF